MTIKCRLNCTCLLYYIMQQKNGIPNKILINVHFMLINNGSKTMLIKIEHDYIACFYKILYLINGQRSNCNSCLEERTIFFSLFLNRKEVQSLWCLLVCFFHSLHIGLELCIEGSLSYKFYIIDTLPNNIIMKTKEEA